MKDTALSEHARYQMRERGISPEEVEMTIHMPNAVAAQPDGKIKAVRRITRGRKRYAIVVIYREEVRSYGVITTFITSKMKKYL